MTCRFSWGLPKVVNGSDCEVKSITIIRKVVDISDDLRPIAQ